MTTVVQTMSAEETYGLGFDMGRTAEPGGIYALNGDLGTGKTVFTKGFAAGLGVREYITSPTFNIIKEYHSGRLPLYHFDVYRIGDPEEMLEIGWEEYVYGEGVCLVEWAEMIEDLVHEIPPEKVLQVEIKKDLSKGNDYRMIQICRKQIAAES